MPRWLHLCLAAPLVAHGGVAVDQVGPTRALPAASALTGLLGNALGWHWRERDRHQALQDRLIFGALVTRPGRLLTDSQNARVYEEEPTWTTYGKPEKRNKSSTYANNPLSTQIGNQEGRKWLTHQRSRTYIADSETRVVLRLDPAEASPTLDDLGNALDRPARPLFIGRKSCLPAGSMNAGWITAQTALAALESLAERVEPAGGAALWPEGQGWRDGAFIDALADMRNWHSGVHVGERRIVRGVLP